MFQRDKDYIVRDGEVIIVDEFTGRMMLGRRYSEGLHQAIEAKEGVRVQRQNVTMATITFQNYFRMYDKLAGMTGTAKTEAEEFLRIYNLDVVAIPTNRDNDPEDYADLVFKTEAAKFNAVVDEIDEMHESGRPVLVGTVSIEKSEQLSEMLKRGASRTRCSTPNSTSARPAIVAEAGQPGAVTIATNMAGRGTDIVLGPKASPRRAACISSAPNGTNRAGSTTSSAVAPAARATPGRSASTSRSKTSSCGALVRERIARTDGTARHGRETFRSSTE